MAVSHVTDKVKKTHFMKYWIIYKPPDYNTCMIIEIFINIIILVIFSTEWYKHDFVWGMFGRHAMDGTVVEDMNIDDDVDMEVDVVGRELVGTVDVNVSSSS